MNEPIKMMLFCPRCRAQHIDAPESDDAYSTRLHESSWWELGGTKPPRWDNPPHATHLCENCGLLWRPANINTTGVVLIHFEARHKVAIFACVPPPMAAHVRVEFRPLLTQGMLATDYRGPKILIDKEQPVDQQNITLWHEVLHLLGLTNEAYVEGLAVRLAVASPEITAIIKEITCSPKSS